MSNARHSARLIRARARRSATLIQDVAAVLLWIAAGAGVEFALTVECAHAATVTVNSTSSVVDFEGAQRVGDLPGPDGVVSFAEAAIATTNTLGPDLIAFNIPLSDPGLLAGSFRIVSEGFITLGDDYTTVDGTTQT